MYKMFNGLQFWTQSCNWSVLYFFRVQNISYKHAILSLLPHYYFCCIFYIFSSVHMCVQFTCMNMPIYEVCKSMAGIFLSHSLPYFLRHDLLMKLEVEDWLVCLDSKLLESAGLYFTSLSLSVLDVQTYTSRPRFLCVCWDYKLRTLSTWLYDQTPSCCLEERFYIYWRSFIFELHAYQNVETSESLSWLKLLFCKTFYWLLVSFTSCT